MGTENNKRRLTAWQWGFLALLIGCTIWILSGNRKQMVPQHSSGKIFGTYYSIKYDYSEALDSLIVVELNKVDHSLSMFNPNSTVARINRNESLSSDSLFSEIFNLSKEVNVETFGDFDVTVAPLVNIWGFGLKNSENVSQQKIDSILDFVGFEKVYLKDGQVVKKDPRLQMDFSAIAKGYGVDLVARLFDSKGIKNYMVEIGGEIVVKGKNSKGKNWKIEIQNPEEKTDVQEKILLSVSDVAMATSGNYRRFYVKDGKRYAHTINGHTGYPVEHSLLSATVFASNCAKADAYATSFMVMGLKNTQKFLESHPELYAYLIYSNAKGELDTWYSPSMEKYIAK